MTWRIAFPGDGHLNEGGLLPPLIEWDAGSVHPASRMPDSGCSLAAFSGFHPDPEAVREQLATIGLEEALDLQQDDHIHLEAEIDTPAGRRTLT